MTRALRTAWNANRHWVAAGFLTSTGLFLLLIFLNWRNEQFGIASSKATGLSATAWDSHSMWHQRSILPSFHRGQSITVDQASGSLGGVVGGVSRAAVYMEPRLQRAAVDMEPQLPDGQTDRQVIRTSTLEIIVIDPLQVAEQLRNFAAQLSGFVVSSSVNGAGEQVRVAKVILRIPADRLDQARAQVRAMANVVEHDTIEARDVTREDVDKEAALRNARAEEAQYRTILKRATSVKDVLEVSSKMAEVQGRIDQIEADLRLLHHQVEMSLLTINITGVAETQVFGIRWRPLYKAKVALHGAISALTDYADSVVELFLNLPVIALWGFTIVALLKFGWLALRYLILLFFPGLTTWLRRPAPAQAS